jgi:transcriptional regulator with XRE-family HTH domain
MPRRIKSRITTPNPVDQVVGRRLRKRRLQLGLSQLGVAEAIGVTFQQIQKYEGGTNRIVASRLFDLAQVLDVPIAYFFPDSESEATNGEDEDFADARHPAPKETLNLVKAYYQIEEPTLRKKLIELVRSVAADET